MLNSVSTPTPTVGVESSQDHDATGVALLQTAGDRAGSLRELQATLDLIPAFVWRTKADGFTEYLNKRWLDYAGMGREQALGWQWLAAIHPEDLPGLTDTWGRVLASGKPGEAEARMRRFDGVYRWFLFRAEPSFDANGKILAWYGVNTDIEDRKQAEDALRLGERRYRQLFHNVPVALWEFDLREIIGTLKRLRADGVSDLSIYLRQNPDAFVAMMDSVIAQDANDSAIRIFGARDREQLLQGFAALWRRTPDTFRRAIESRYRGESKYQEETKFTTLDGREIAVHFVSARLGLDGDRERGLVALVDISDRARAQERLQQVQADFAHAARVSMLGELTASIAHEVNQPLGAIRTNGETALRWLDRDEPNLGKTRASIKRMLDDAGRASEVVARIRGLAAGRAPQQTAVALHEVIGQSLLFLRHELQSKGVSLSLDLAQPLPSVRGDHTQLQQVIVNLAINAVQALVKSDVVRRNISIRTLQISSERVCCIIEDSGPGIDPAHLPHLFDSFFTTKEGGMGLGLPIARSIIEAHDGHLRADNDSVLGGARFIIELPPSRASES